MDDSQEQDGINIESISGLMTELSTLLNNPTSDFSEIMGTVDLIDRCLDDESPDNSKVECQLCFQQFILDIDGGPYQLQLSNGLRLTQKLMNKTMKDFYIAKRLQDRNELIEQWIDGCYKMMKTLAQWINGLGRKNKPIRSDTEIIVVVIEESSEFIDQAIEDDLDIKLLDNLHIYFARALILALKPFFTFPEILLPVTKSITCLVSQLSYNLNQLEEFPKDSTKIELLCYQIKTLFGLLNLYPWNSLPQHGFETFLGLTVQLSSCMVNSYPADCFSLLNAQTEKILPYITAIQSYVIYSLGIRGPIGLYQLLSPPESWPLISNLALGQLITFDLFINSTPDLNKDLFPKNSDINSHQGWLTNLTNLILSLPPQSLIGNHEQPCRKLLIRVITNCSYLLPSDGFDMIEVMLVKLLQSANDLLIGPVLEAWTNIVYHLPIPTLNSHIEALLEWFDRIGQGSEQINQRVSRLLNFMLASIGENIQNLVMAKIETCLRNFDSNPIGLFLLVSGIDIEQLLVGDIAIKEYTSKILRLFMSRIDQLCRCSVLIDPLLSSIHSLLKPNTFDPSMTNDLTFIVSKVQTAISRHQVWKEPCAQTINKLMEVMAIAPEPCFNKTMQEGLNLVNKRVRVLGPSKVGPDAVSVTVRAMNIKSIDQTAKAGLEASQRSILKAFFDLSDWSTTLSALWSLTLHVRNMKSPDILKLMPSHTKGLVNEYIQRMEFLANPSNDLATNGYLNSEEIENINRKQRIDKLVHFLNSFLIDHPPPDPTDIQTNLPFQTINILNQLGQTTLEAIDLELILTKANLIDLKNLTKTVNDRITSLTEKKTTYIS